MTAAEVVAADYLDGVPIELRDKQGTLKVAKKTTGGGAYGFGPSDTAMPTLVPYIVNPVVNRTQSAIPLHRAIASLPVTGISNQDFQVRGWPAIIQISNARPGTLVVISKAALAGANPPPQVGPGAAGSAADIYSAVTGLDGKVDIPVPYGSYNITCWKPPQGPGSYTRTPTAGSNLLLGGPFNPATNHPVTASAANVCP